MIEILKVSEKEVEKEIANCVNKEMRNVRIELKNGNTVRVSARAVKNFYIHGWIDSLDVNREDRRLLDKIKNSAIIEKPITARDIKRITHRRRILFENKK